MPRGDTLLRNVRQRELKYANRDRILEFLRDSPGSTRGDVCRSVGLAGRHVDRHINELITNGIVNGAFEGDRWQRLRVAA